MAINTTLNATLATLNVTLEKLIDRYTQLEQRDRIALSGLGLFFSLFISRSRRNSVISTIIWPPVL